MVDGILFSLFLVPENWVLARSRIYKDMLKLQGDPHSKLQQPQAELEALTRKPHA